MLDVRSGEFVAGNFAEIDGYSQPGEPDFRAKIYWVPDDRHIAEAEVLKVTVEKMHDGARSHTQRFGGDGTNAWSDGRYFWPSGISLPEHGQWRLTAVAPDHWGCLLITI